MRLGRRMSCGEECADLASRSGLVVEEKRRDLRARRAVRISGSAVGRRGRRRRLLERLEELLENLGGRVVARGAARRVRRGAGRRAVVRRGRTSSGTTRAAGPLGEGGLEHAFQLGGLVGGDRAVRDLSGDEVVDLRFEVPRDDLVPLESSLDRLCWIAESLSLSAVDSADSSDDETVPAETSDCNSCCRRCSGD
jgi:hypothetical protein